MRRKVVDARCSFCGKTQGQVSRLIAGPGVFICSDCVALCNEVINEKPPTAPIEANAQGSVRKRGQRGRWLGRWFRAQELLPAQR